MKGPFIFQAILFLYEGVEEVINWFNIKIAVLFMGAAKVKEVGPDHLTMAVDEAITFAQKFLDIKIVPLHFEGWAHFSESRTCLKINSKRQG